MQLSLIRLNSSHSEFASFTFLVVRFVSFIREPAACQSSSVRMSVCLSVIRRRRSSPLETSVPHCVGALNGVM